MKTKIRFNHCGPQFAVENVPKAIKFYSSVLGFEVDYLSGSPAGYAVVFRDEVYIHLCHQETQPFTIWPGCVFIAVTGVEEIWKKIQLNKTEIINPLEERDYGQGICFKIFTIKDPDQNILRIGEPIDESNNE